MKACVGIDLGSTTTKAIVLDESSRVLGRGITNSRSNYRVACEVALSEGLISARFGLVEAELEGTGVDSARWLPELERLFRMHQYLAQLAALAETMTGIHARGEAVEGFSRPTLEEILGSMEAEVAGLYAAGARRKSDFFRDLAGSRYLSLAEQSAREHGESFDALVSLFDKSILAVENLPASQESFRSHAVAALTELDGVPEDLTKAAERAADVTIEQVMTVCTGYGRRTLPFPKELIRSEILCHGLGAHAMYPDTRTVLDIGGQDTKAIQVDDRGIVTSFQMNDRCAAGCGRYLGYIADEMNLGVHELGPLAASSSRPTRINSTCTVFAGAELRERLSLGERREDILAGLHRAVILRAMSLLARSGGISDQFTFTGGVAKNEAAVEALAGLVRENYGDVAINISPDSIYTGALGAGLFAWREWQQAAA